MADDVTCEPATATVAFVRNIWYVGLWSSELSSGAMVSRTILNERCCSCAAPTARWRQSATPARTASRRCRWARFSRATGCKCPYHGLEFGADGRCVHNPHGTGAIPAAAHLRTYPVVEKHQVLWIWMGTRAPDPDKIPDYSCLDTADPLFVTEPGYLRMQAGYELVVDNLLDLSHICYLHAGLLGTAGVVDADIKMTQTGDTVTVTRRSKDADTPSMLTLMGAGARTDQWTSITWFPPSNLLLDFGGCAPGAAKSTGTGYFAIHFLTPETARTTHYNFTAVRFNVPTDGQALNEEIRAKIAAGSALCVRRAGPAGDRGTAATDGSGAGAAAVLLAIDAGPVQYARVLERLKKEEVLF